VSAISFALFTLEVYPSRDAGVVLVAISALHWPSLGVACSPGVANKEGHLSRCDGLGCNYKVAFILTILVIEDNDEFAILYGESQLVPRVDL
jgi:hypothetical protein